MAELKNLNAKKIELRKTLQNWCQNSGFFLSLLVILTFYAFIITMVITIIIQKLSPRISHIWFIFAANSFCEVDLDKICTVFKSSLCCVWRKWFYILYFYELNRNAFWKWRAHSKSGIYIYLPRRATDDNCDVDTEKMEAPNQDMWQETSKLY